MMKRYKLILLSVCILPLLLSSCNKWLDVSPEDQITENDLWSKGEGFRNALNGVYKSMAGFDLYGRHLTWGIVDALGQCYDYSYASVSDMETAAEYKFNEDELKPKIQTIWEEAYNTVANCNNILKNIPNANPDLFDAKEREKYMIWGEALALRAFIQFDMLRLFAPAPITNPTKKYLPYLNAFPSLISNKKTVNECLDYIIADLKEAKQLLWKYDSIVDMTTQYQLEIASIGESQFLSNRRWRLNYYAASAELARVYLYAGKKEEAYQEALAIIKVQDAKKYFNYANRASRGDLKFYHDVLMGLYAPKLGDWDRNMNEVMSNGDLRYVSLLNTEDIFSPDLKRDNDNKLTSDDYRFKYQIEDYKGYGYYFRPLKYRAQGISTTESNIANQFVPMIRMSEVYYIAAEAICETNLEEAKDYLFRVKAGRGFRSSTIVAQKAAITTVSDFLSILRMDLRRELSGEGQIFFMFKRNNLEIPGNYKVIPAEEKTFVLPIPESEIDIK